MVNAVADGGGGGYSQYSPVKGDGLIDPDQIPCKDLHPARLAVAAESFKNHGAGLETEATSLDTTWAKLGGVYVAPESATVVGLLAPVKTDATSLSGKMSTVSTALGTFAEAVVPIKTALEGIKTEAVTFVASVENGVWVEPSNPANPQFQEWVNRQSYTYTPPVSSSYGNYGQPTEPEALHGCYVNWKDDQVSVDRNTELIDAVSDQYAKLDAAQVECGNTILGLVENSCVTTLTAVEAWQLKQDGSELPWGSRVEKNRDCGESFVHGMGEAVVSFGEGIGSLFGYNPLKGEWGDGEFAAQAWQGLGMTLAGLVIMTSPSMIGLTLMPGPAGDFARDAEGYTVNALKGIVAWDTWGENPAEAAGTTLVNVGTFFIPGAGEVAGVLKATAAGARVASIATLAGRVVDVAVPGGSFIIRGLAEGGGELARFARGADDAITFDVRLGENPAGLLGNLPDGGGLPHGDGSPDLGFGDHSPGPDLDFGGSDGPGSTGGGGDGPGSTFGGGDGPGSTFGDGDSPGSTAEGGGHPESGSTGSGSTTDTGGTPDAGGHPTSPQGGSERAGSPAGSGEPVGTPAGSEPGGRSPVGDPTAPHGSGEPAGSGDPAGAPTSPDGSGDPAGNPAGSDPTAPHSGDPAGSPVGSDPTAPHGEDAGQPGAQHPSDVYGDRTTVNADGEPIPYADWVKDQTDLPDTSGTKGEYGEIRVDESMSGNGWDRIDNGADGSKNPNAPGVDGIYVRDTPTGSEFAVVEAKYGTSRLGNTLDGLQMSESWLNGDVTGTNRLDNALSGLDPSVRDSFFEAYDRGEVGSVLAHVDPDGTVSYSSLDADGHVIRGADPFPSAHPGDPSATPLEVGPTATDADSAAASGPTVDPSYATAFDGDVSLVPTQALPPHVADTFLDGQYRTVVTDHAVTAYRVHGGSADIGGSYATTEPAGNRMNAKITAALPVEWLNTREFETVIEVPAGEVLQLGKVAPQPTLSGAILPGGADQVLLPQGWPADWIRETHPLPAAFNGRLP